MDASFIGLTLLAWLGTYALHSSLFLGGAILWNRWHAPRSPRMRERIWRLGLLGGVLTTSLQLGFGAEPFLGRWSLEAEATTAAVTEPGPTRIPVAELEAPRTIPTTTTRATDAGAESKPSPRTLPVRHEAPTRRETTRNSTSDLRLASRTTERPVRSTETRPLATTPLVRPVSPAATSATVAPTVRDPEPLEIAWGEATVAVESDGFESEARDESAARALVVGSLARVRDLVWPHRALALWGFGAACAFALLGLGFAWLGLTRRLADRRPLEGPVRDQLDRLMRTAGFRGKVRLSVSPSTAVPITWGFVRREICLPERTLTDLTDGQTATLLAHELAHAVRRDPIWFTVYALVERAFFFQPLNRMARRELHATAELLCDDQAVRWTGKRLELASCLTEVAHWIVDRRPRAIPAAFMAESSSRLYHRVERLLDDRRSPVPEGRQAWWTPAALSALGLVALGVPGLSATSADAPLPPAPSPTASAPTKKASAPDAAPRVDAPAPSIPTPAPAPASVPTLSPAATAVGTPARAPLIPPAAVSEQIFELVDIDLDLLSEETDALRRELAERDLAERFAAPLDTIEHRMRTLRDRRDRLEALAERMLSETASSARLP